MNTEWITDRLPTEEDALEYTVLLWDGSKAILWSYDGVNEGQPWAPIHKLIAPYVKPKRWTVKWGGEDGNSDFFTLYDSGEFRYYLPELTSDQSDAAQRICDIYNEVLP
jgi:hypothetical protein